MPKTWRPVTFIACLSGSTFDRARLLRTLGGALHPNDEAIAVDGNYGPAPATADVRFPNGLTVLRLADAPLAMVYDRLAETATHDYLIFVGTGCCIARADMDRLRSRLTTTAGAVVLTPSRTGSTVVLDARSVIGVNKTILNAVGGFASTENRARRVDAGFVGSGDLFEVFQHEVRRAGWSVEQVQHHVKPADGAGSDRTTTAGGDDADTAVPPSRRIPADLREAMGTTALATVSWFSQFLPESQVEALTALVGEHGHLPEDEGGWNTLAVARMLWWRGQRPYAAQLLERCDLESHTDPAEVADIAAILSATGRPMATLVEKLGHAGTQLAAVLAAKPVDEATEALRQWWELEPDAEALHLAVLALAPSLSLSDAVTWHDRVRTMPGICSPLLALAQSPDRRSDERAVAIRCLEMDDPAFCQPDLVALLAALEPAASDAVERAARDLLMSTGVAAS